MDALLVRILRRDGLFGQRNKPEYMPEFRAVVVIEVIHDRGIYLDQLMQKRGRDNRQQDKYVYVRNVDRLSNSTIVLGCQRTRA